MRSEPSEVRASSAKLGRVGDIERTLLVAVAVVASEARGVSVDGAVVVIDIELVT